jgi:hypothetical protein
MYEQGETGMGYSVKGKAARKTKSKHFCSIKRHKMDITAKTLHKTPSGVI